MHEHLKNFFIGLFVLAAIALVVSTVMFLKPSVGDMKETLYVRFSDINRINEGTRVLFAGKPVGEVVEIREIHDARQQPTDALGRVYFYELVLKIDSGIKVYNTDEVAIQVSGLLGEKSIAIIPKAPPPGVVPQRITNQPIYADSMDPFETAILEVSDLANEMEGTFKQVTKWIKDHGEEVASAVKATQATMEEIDRAVTTVNETELIEEMQRATQSFEMTMNQFQDAMQELKEMETFKNTGIVMDNLRTVSHSLDTVTDDLASGKGTLGKLIVDDDLYLRMNAIFSKADTLMNDINHYGILFHLNKSWQRQRLQRVNLLNALNTPCSFKNYFNQEVDQINTSMARLSMLIDRAELSPERELILENAQFEKDFAELLRQSEELSENLRLYNQQLMEAKNQQCEN